MRIGVKDHLFSEQKYSFVTSQRSKQFETRSKSVSVIPTVGKKMTVCNAWSIIIILYTSSIVYRYTHEQNNHLLFCLELRAWYCGSALCRIEKRGGGFAFNPLTELEERGGLQYVFFSRLDHQEDYSDPCYVTQAKNVTGGTNKKMGQDLGQLQFNKPSASISGMSQWPSVKTSSPTKQSFKNIFGTIIISEAYCSLYFVLDQPQYLFVLLMCLSKTNPVILSTDSVEKMPTELSRFTIKMLVGS